METSKSLHPSSSGQWSSDPWTIIIIVLTFALFGLALVFNGFTHDVLLEAGVFLVSVKLMLMAKKNHETEKRMEQHLVEIKGLLSPRNSLSAD
jgi:hypothetical protein